MSTMAGLLMMVMFLVAVFLILLVLVQRGKGGGLAGALGGMGGQSAFGTKAGDLFTRITIVTATVWILLCVGTIKLLSSNNLLQGQNFGANAQEDDGAGLDGAATTGGGAGAGAGASGDEPAATGESNAGEPASNE